MRDEHWSNLPFLIEVEMECDTTTKSKKVSSDEDKWEPSTSPDIFLQLRKCQNLCPKFVLLRLIKPIIVSKAKTW